MLAKEVELLNNTKSKMIGDDLQNDGDEIYGISHKNGGISVTGYPIRQRGFGYGMSHRKWEKVMGYPITCELHSVTKRQISGVDLDENAAIRFLKFSRLPYRVIIENYYKKHVYPFKSLSITGSDP